MKSLNENWLSEGLMDYEYKKYILLDYLQKVKTKFEEYQLYPSLSELITHYGNLKNIKENKSRIKSAFPKELSKADFENLKLVYKDLIDDNEIIEELDRIISFAMPRIKEHLQEGKSLYEYVEEQVKMEPVGITPLYKDEGYLFIYEMLPKHTDVYYYHMKIFSFDEEKYRSIRTEYIQRYDYSLSNSFNNIKLELIRNNKKLPNPATYLAYVEKPFPVNETVLPITKRMLLQKIAA